MAGYRYDISILQAEFSTTQVLDRPVHGRLFFEQVIGENLDLGRPEEVRPIFNRRRGCLARGGFRTRIVTADVTPSLNIYYKSARIKQVPQGKPGSARDHDQQHLRLRCRQAPRQPTAPT